MNFRSLNCTVNSVCRGLDSCARLMRTHKAETGFERLPCVRAYRQLMLSACIFPSDSVNSMGNHFYLTGSLDISALWTDIASGVS